MAQSGGRQRIIEAARRLLAEGVSPSAEAVAAAAGMSRSNYFRLVGSHTSLLREAGHIDPDSRSRIIAAAVAVLSERGVSAMSMEQVAERAGVSRATVYRIFSSKADLMTTIATTWSPMRTLAPLLMQLSDREPHDVLPPLFMAATPRIIASRGLLRAVLAEPGMDSPDNIGARSVMRETYAVLEQYVAKQMDAGRMRRTDPLAAVQALIGPLLFFAVTGPDFWHAEGEERPRPEDSVAAIVEVWLRGMAP